MSTQDTREKYAKEAVVERLWSHTVGIANRALASQGTDPSSGLPGREEEAPGTGIAARWGHHHFILTAKHVLDNAQPNDLTFFARPTGAFTHTSEITRDDALSAVSLNDSNATISRCDWEDLALLMTKPDVLGPYLEFVDVQNLWTDPSEGETVIGLGFPVSSGFIFGKRFGTHLQKDIVLAPIGFSGDVLSSTTGRLFKGFNADRQYLIPYELAVQGKHPRGISGAAVWVPAHGEHTVWAARLKFAGICTSCYRNGTIEQIVKASVVRQFLTEVFGDANDTADSDPRME
jgi:hypothetical protein